MAHDPVHSVRLWDTRTAWLNLEPAQDQWEFGQLDAQIALARAHGVKDITLVLWGTPVWAASSLDEDDAGWLGPGAAAMPRNINDWREFIAKVAARYRGVITAYEIGNEPEDRKFWRGTTQQFAQMVSTAASTIHETDPGAVVVAPATLIAKDQGTAGIGERTLVNGTNEEARRLGLERVYWYAWKDLGPPQLLQLQPGTPAEAALRASSEQIASRKP